MSLLAVARKDLVEARAGALGPLCVGMMLLYAAIAGLTLRTPAPGEAVTVALGSATLGIVPFVALIFSYETVAYERSRETIRLLLSLPHTRREVVLGLYLGRLGVLGTALALALATGAVTGLALGASVEPFGVLAFLGVGLLLAVTYAGVAVGVSATTDSANAAFAGALPVFGLSVAWDAVVGWVRRALADVGLIAGSESWWSTLATLDPVTAVQDVLGALPLRLAMVGDATAQDAVVGVAVCLAWAAVPLAVGSWRFERAEL